MMEFPKITENVEIVILTILLIILIIVISKALNNFVKFIEVSARNFG